MKDPEEIEEEARLLLGATSVLCALFIVFSHLGDTVAIVYIYLGWCIYVMIFSIRFHNKYERAHDEKAGN